MNFQQFQEELNKLKQGTPLVPTHSLHTENSDFGDYLYFCNNAYISFDDARCENIMYVCDSFKAKYCIDGDYVVESENCYECVDVLKCYNSAYLNFCTRLYDSYYCYDCSDSNNLFGCVHLKYKSHCIFNKQYTPEEYTQRVQELLKFTPVENLKGMNILLLRFPVTTSYVTQSENSDYCNQVHHSNNLYLSFDASNSEDSSYLYDSHYIKNSSNLTQCANCEFCYECTDSARLNNCMFMKHCEDTFDSAFCEDCSNSNHLLGCVGISKKEYCILNKQYPKEEYNRQVDAIIQSVQTS